jgi:hypothetical protein
MSDVFQCPEFHLCRLHSKRPDCNYCRTVHFSHTRFEVEESILASRVERSHYDEQHQPVD